MTTLTNDELNERLVRVEEKLDELLEILTEDGTDRFWQAKLAILGRMMDMEPHILNTSEEWHREHECKEWKKAMEQEEVTQ
jgi:hypothetical protein